MDKRNKCNQRRRIWCLINCCFFSIYNVKYPILWTGFPVGALLNQRQDLPWTTGSTKVLVGFLGFSIGILVFFNQQRELFHHVSLCLFQACCYTVEASILKATRGLDFHFTYPGAIQWDWSQKQQLNGFTSQWWDISLFDLKQWKLAYHPTSKNTPLIIPHSHFSWASFKHFPKFVDIVLWFAISKSAIFKDTYFCTMFSFDCAYVGLGKLNPHRNRGSTITWHLVRLRHFTDSCVPQWKSIVVLHNSTAVLME